MPDIEEKLDAVVMALEQARDAVLVAALVNSQRVVPDLADLREELDHLRSALDG